MSAFCYNIYYDFLEDDDILPNWEEPLNTPPSSRSSTPPKNETTDRIYDGMAGLFIASTMDELALEYSALVDFILDNPKAIAFLIDNGPIRNALRTFTLQIRKEYPAAYQYADAMETQLDIIKGEHGE